MNHDIGYRVSMVEDFHRQFEYSIDPKNRINIPASYIWQIENRLKLHNYPDFLANLVSVAPHTDHIKIYDALGYERKAKDLKSMAKIISDVHLDKQGRLLIPENCRRIFAHSRIISITPSPDLDSIIVRPLKD